VPTKTVAIELKPPAPVAEFGYCSSVRKNNENAFQAVGRNVKMAYIGFRTACQQIMSRNGDTDFFQRTSYCDREPSWQDWDSACQM